ncbi:putative porin [Glaciecola sp. MH2013]|uniref:putative porin n=1 Tax=Glaciecola sp. MH2013 TaxID=2785524 RepID=UPI0018A07CEF|nr:putative porin [Glaciecola sp. MH2013]MBF7074895.1 putative porin [Glaciecola sp. MH2013]
MFSKTTLSLATLAAIAFSQNAFADDYQTFFGASVTSNKTTVKGAGSSTSESREAWNLNMQYYFDPRPTLGPLAEFDFINQQSRISAGLFGASGNRQYSLAGEYIMDSLVFSGTTVYDNDSDTEFTNIGLAYFINKDIKLSISRESSDGLGGLFDSDESVFSFGADYVHQMQGNDYVGVSYRTDEDFLQQIVNTKYFTALSGGRYLTVDATLNVFDDDFFSDERLDLGASYYFNDYTSIGAGFNLIGDDDSYSLFARHFFNKRSSILLSYANSESEFVSFGDEKIKIKNDSWNLSYVYQY